ncbi:DMT family transporter [Allofournierella sp.]|uniref:DMT family transporter n=1 Tax=Allofournierella sp. TaxID=1940256 RepID=UPI003AB79A85
MVKKARSSWYWVALMLLNALLFAAGDACNKYVTGIPMWEKVFLRSLIGLVFIVFTFVQSKDKFVVGHWPWQLARAAVGFMVTYTTFYAAVNMPLGDFTTVKNLGPLFAIVFTVLILKDKLNKFAIPGMVISFIGLLIITPPQFGSSIVPMLVAIAAAMFIGMLEVCGRALRKYSNPSSVMLISMVFMTAVSGGLMLADGQPFVMPPVTMLLAILGIAILPTFSQHLGVYIGFNVSPVKTMVYNYVGPIWAVLLGFIIFGEVPTLQFLVGAVFILGGGIFSALKNRPEADKKPEETAKTEG